jgi:2-dehydro-3-deoxygluconokinase
VPANDQRSATRPRFDVTSLGETMLRLSVPSGRRLEDTAALDVHPGGAESNVCAALASLDRRCSWVSRLPDDPLGKLILRRLHAANVDTSAVVLAPEGRVGTYYVEYATPPRPIRVIYDRANSALSHMTVAEVDWGTLLDTRVLHLTGITPALSASCRELVQEAIGRANKAGVAVSFDVNYRQRLWSPEEAAEALRPLIADVELLFCTEADARLVFRCGGDEQQVVKGLQSLTRASTVVMTLGDAGALAWEAGVFLEQAAIPARTVDRLGAGDAFAAGVLDGWLDGSLAEGLEQGAALAALALAQMGDMLITSRAEMEAIRLGAGRGIWR